MTLRRKLWARNQKAGLTSGFAVPGRSKRRTISVQVVVVVGNRECSLVKLERMKERERWKGAQMCHVWQWWVAKMVRARHRVTKWLFGG